MGPTLIIWCTIGVSARRAPAIRAMRGLQTPQQITQMPVSMSPAVVRTARTCGLLPVPVVSMPSTPVPASTVSAPAACARSRIRVPARSESTTPTVGKCPPPRTTVSSRYGTSLRISAGVSIAAGIPHALAAEQRRRSSAIRSAVRATSIPPLWVKTRSSWYCSVLSRVSSIIIFEYSIGKMKLEACPVDPPGLGIGPLSTRTRSRQPSRARVSLMPLNTANQSVASPLPDAGPAAGMLAAGPVPSPVRTLRLLDRDLLVDEAQVDALPPAHDAGDHVQHDRQ